MRIGVVVLNYNDWQTTTRNVIHIKTLKNISCIAIVDNCSTDDSVRQLSSLEDDNTFLLVSSHNGGYSAGNNIGLRFLIEERDVDYVIVTNPDIIFQQNFVDEGAFFLNKENDLISITGRMKYPSGHYDKHPFLKLPRYSRVLAGFILPLDKLLSSIDCEYVIDESGDIQYVESLPGCLYMIKSSFIKQIGYFDEGTFLYYEEAILGKQIMEYGGKCGVMTHVDYVHDHAKSISKNIKYVQINKLYNKSGFYYFKKYCNINVCQQFLYLFLSRLCILQYQILSFIKNR